MSDFGISVDSAPFWIWITILAVALLDHEFSLVYFGSDLAWMFVKHSKNTDISIG
ncbi:hypothetical protein B0H14DRAFT_3494067 [Mycena olivaceomarginata]|nr:hypothetical protein B0H14DRAFT_3494067 [Mycena olivaceomarginata]